MENTAMAMTPEQLAASGTEDGVQRALLLSLALYIRPAYPLIDLIYHVPNGGSRGADARSAKITGAMMNALGVKKGTPDLCLPIPFQGYGALYIEMKKPKDGALSKDQMQRIKMLAQAGNAVAVVDDWVAGYWLIHSYLYSRTPAEFKMAYMTKQICEGIAIFDPSNYFRLPK